MAWLAFARCFVSQNFLLLGLKIYLIGSFPADIYDEVSDSVRCLGFDTECLGGGRIEHFPEQKLIKVYGHSTVSEDYLEVAGGRWHTIQYVFLFQIYISCHLKGFGKADHQESRRLLLTKYTDYEIETSDEGY